MSDTPRTDAEERRQAALNDPSIRNYAAAWPELARTLERELSRAMTNRDQFAAAALTGIVSAGTHRLPLMMQEEASMQGLPVMHAYAQFAYALADAMLARRSVQPKTGAPSPQPSVSDTASQHD